MNWNWKCVDCGDTIDLADYDKAYAINPDKAEAMCHRCNPDEAAMCRDCGTIWCAYDGAEYCPEDMGGCRSMDTFVVGEDCYTISEHEKGLAKCRS